MTHGAETRTADRLRKAGLRVTGSRLAILAELERNRQHPSAWDLHQLLKARHPSLSVSTVYETLEAFARAGLVRRLPVKDGGMRVDGTTERHDHAVCRGCGGVFDVPAAPTPAVVKGVLPRGFKVLASRVEYDVLCARCHASAGKS